ncbi:hypothetical protein AB8S08_11470 [Pseudidiomarina sp. PP-1MA]|uniref:PD(D/E)XK endonuclease domain-containing protein n=1 Tax=Pseudidiomarina sp. PP-1MA TaxID=3237706 RepID=A0AB39X9F8_9GAMM
MKHSENSSFREKLIEHLFVGELLKLSWQDYDCSLEVASPEVDNAGYDVIAEDRGIVRHIQLKASYIGGKTANQKVHTRLADKPSGCVIWIYFDQDTLELGPFYFFGSTPGEKLPDLSGMKIARHTKGDQDGYKAERPNIRVIPKGKFKKINSIEEVYDVLFKA